MSKNKMKFGVPVVRYVPLPVDGVRVALEGLVPLGQVSGYCRVKKHTRWHGVGFGEVGIWQRVAVGDRSVMPSEVDGA